MTRNNLSKVLLVLLLSLTQIDSANTQANFLEVNTALNDSFLCCEPQTQYDHRIFKLKELEKNHVTSIQECRDMILQAEAGMEKLLENHSY